MSGPLELDLCHDCYGLADEMVPAEVTVKVGDEQMRLCTSCAEEWRKVAEHDGVGFTASADARGEQKSGKGRG